MFSGVRRRIKWGFRLGKVIYSIEFNTGRMKEKIPRIQRNYSVNLGIFCGKKLHKK